MHRTASARRVVTAVLLALGTGCASGAQSGASAARPAGPGVLLVANQGDASASHVDLATGAVTRIPVGTGPHETAISSDGRWGVVTVYGAQTPGNQLALVDMRTRQTARTIDLGTYRRPHDVQFLPGSTTRVAVTSEASQRVVVVDLEAGAVQGDVETRAQGSHMLALADDGRTLYTANVGSGSVSRLDLSTRSFVSQLPIAARTEGIAITPDGREVWVGSNTAGTVSVVQVARDTVVATLPSLGMPYRIAISRDGRRALIPDPEGNRVHVADVPARRVLGEIAGIGSPRGVEFTPDGRTAFVTLGPEAEVLVVDVEARRVTGRHAVGAAPDGVAWGPAAR
jgi:YVTN family beta-propeller protein